MRRAMRAMGWKVGVAALVLAVAGVAGAANIWVVDNTCCPTLPIPQSFFRIQDAIDFASPGDTIVVRTNNTYTEALVIDKDNLTVVGEGNTTISPNDPGCANSDPGVTIEASGVRFQGFHIISETDGSCLTVGILVTGSDNLVVANWVEVISDFDGIELDGDSKRNTVLGNWVTGTDPDLDQHGITTCCGSGWGHLIAYNVVSGMGRDGIVIQVQQKVTADYNVVVNNDDAGFYVDAKNFKLTNNIALDNQGNDDFSGPADLNRQPGATGTFKKNVFENCLVNGSSATCPAF